MVWDQTLHSEIENRISEDDFESYIDDLLNSDMFEEEMHKGITKLVKDRGYDHLTDSQKRVFMFYVLAPNYISKCARDASDIPWCEMVETVTEGDNLCSYCRHMLKKDD